MDGVNAAQYGHSDIYHNHVRLKAERFRNQRSAVTRGPYNIKVGGK